MISVWIQRLSTNHAACQRRGRRGARGEPAASFAAEVTDARRRRYRPLCGAGIAIILIGHRMELVTAISDEVPAIDDGEFIARGEPGAIQYDRRVFEAYLGRAAG